MAGEGAARAATTEAATLETKYYTATLRVRTTVVAARGHTGATGDAANVQAASADSAADDAEEHSDAEALVLVYDAREEASFSQALAQWVEGAGAGAGGAGAPLGESAPSTSPTPAPRAAFSKERLLSSFFTRRASDGRRC